MIWESGPWKKSLSSDAKKIVNLDLNNDSSAIKLEKVIFISAYTIRKLIEAHKLTDKVKNIEIECRKLHIKNGDKFPDSLNWHDIDRFYDLSKSSVEKMGLKNFTNQIIHSFIFAPIAESEENSKITGIFVTTDFDRKKFLYAFELSDIVQTLHAVAEDNIIRSERVRDANGDWIVKNYGHDSV